MQARPQADTGVRDTIIFPEATQFVVNYLLNRRPRATPRHRLDQEFCFWGVRRPPPPESASRRRLGDFWMSPQRRWPPGASWLWPSRRLLLLPPATGLGRRALCELARMLLHESQPHASPAGPAREMLGRPGPAMPGLWLAGWKHRWQCLNHEFLGKRMRHLTPLYL